MVPPKPVTTNSREELSALINIRREEEAKFGITKVCSGTMLRNFGGIKNVINFIYHSHIYRERVF